MDEMEMEFKRFPAEKQDQIRQLVSYTTLLGLTGKDLVSIGGKLDRIKQRAEIERNREIVKGMEVRTIGKDTHMRRRWAHKANDTTYYFFDAGWCEVKIKNTKTNVTKATSWVDFYEFGKFNIGGNTRLPNIMLNVYYGNIKLDF